MPNDPSNAGPGSRFSGSPCFGSHGATWALRHNLSAYDACYVALAEALDCPLLTADARMALAPGPECSFIVVPG